MPVPRLKDVAAKAGVSVAAASLALSGKGRISTEVRERVRAAAAELSYRTGLVPRTRASARQAVGILHSEDRAYEVNFVRPTLLELERAMLQRGYNPVLLPVNAAMPAEQAVTYRYLVENIRTADHFVCRLGLNSLCFWAQRQPVGATLVGWSWQTIPDETQQELVEACQGAGDVLATMALVVGAAALIGGIGYAIASALGKKEKPQD